MQQCQVEQEEEYITNKLMKRLEQLKREKQALATEVSLLVMQLGDSQFNISWPSQLLYTFISYELRTWD